MTNTMTSGWLLYRVMAGTPQFLGLYQTREAAEKEVVALKGTDIESDWMIARVPFVGWGYVVPGVFSQNGKPPLKIVE